MLKHIFVLVVALATAAPTVSQIVYSSGRWSFGGDRDGELGAEIATEIGHGIRVELAFRCNEKGRYSYIGYSGAAYPAPEDLTNFIDSFMEGDLRIETYKAGARTNSFRPTGFHEGQGDPVTDARLRSLQEADFLLITGGKRPIALPTTNARLTLAQFIAACSVYGGAK